jgi:hypothetical protein
MKMFSKSGGSDFIRIVEIVLEVSVSSWEERDAKQF